MNPTSTSTRTRTTTAAGPGTAPPLPADLEQVLRRMRLPYLRAAAPEVLATAKAQRWDPAEVLRVLLAEEVRGRDEATKAMRRKAAGLPAGKTFASWREADSSIPAPPVRPGRPGMGPPRREPRDQRPLRHRQYHMESLTLVIPGLSTRQIVGRASTGVTGTVPPPATKPP